MLTKEGRIAVEKEWVAVKTLLKSLKDLENQWDVFSRNDTFGRAFWLVDKKIVRVYKKLLKRRFSTHPIRDQEDLTEYINHLEVQLKESADLSRSGKNG